MRILGVDPGLRVTGFGIIESRAQNLQYITSGCIRTGQGEIGDRLKTIFEGLSNVVGKKSVDEVAIEKVFLNKNPQTTLSLGQARGAAICAVALRGFMPVEYTALQVKKSVVGYGHAEKKQVQLMVQRLLGLDKVPPSDAADALACAICHAGTLKVTKKIDSRRLDLKKGRLI